MSGDETRLRCANCGREGAEAMFDAARRVTERHLPGDRFSDRECPSCGALAFPMDPVRTRRRRTARYLVVHEHRHGAGVYTVRSPTNLAALEPGPWQDDLAVRLGIDFEPQLNERLYALSWPSRTRRVFVPRGES
jgi:hypothetical protein